jgi:CarD family transcriptional regulator
MPFKVGDRVVHPTYGVGSVVRLETKQLGPQAAHVYYEIATSKSTIWVEVDAPTAGLRPLTAKSHLVRYRRLLKGRPAPLNRDYHERHVELAARLRQGSFEAKCEIVRDLTAHGRRKRLSEADAALLRLTRESLCQEWAAAKGVSVFEASQEIEELLSETGRSAVAG